MNREEINEILQYGVSDMNQVRAICDLALNSIPKAFDENDESTWPETNGEYLVYCNGGKDGTATLNWIIEIHPDCLNYWSKEYQVTHYMPIPEVGESK